MKLYTHFDCPFNCPCFWPCYFKHQIDIDTIVGCKRECFVDFDYIESHAKTGDIYSITTAGHWGFGPVWGSCQRRHSAWSHIGVCYVKTETYKDDLAAEFVEVIDANPDETLFTVEAALSGCVMNPLRPTAENLQSRMFAGYLTVMPVKQEIRDRTENLDQMFSEICNTLSDGEYQFNPCQCFQIVCDVWPCGCNCCQCMDSSAKADADFDQEGVCTEYGVRIMKGLGYFTRHESDTRATIRLKEEINSMPPEEIICNDILNQTYLFDHERQMIIAGEGITIRAEPLRRMCAPTELDYESP